MTNGVGERPFASNHTYAAFCDPSGGRQDRFALAVAHTECDLAFLDAVRVWTPPFNPLSVVAEAATLLHAYRIREVHGDRYAADFVTEVFRTHGVTYIPADHDRSRLYLELLPRVNAGRVVLLDVPDLVLRQNPVRRASG